MLEKFGHVHKLGENIVIFVVAYKPDRKHSNTVLKPDSLEMFLERREPKVILKTRDRTVYELLEGEIYMEVKEMDIADRHLFDTEIAVIDVIEKGKDPKVWLYKILWFEPNTYELIIGKQKLNERLKELQSEAIFIRREALSFLSGNSKAGG
jgi:predicted Ser/Thr protein kinase